MSKIKQILFIIVLTVISSVLAFEIGGLVVRLHMKHIGRSPYALIGE